MARKRLNDTRALAGPLAGPDCAEASHSISSEKIDNGWLVRSSSCNPETGEYKSSVRFCESQPRLMPGRVAGQGAGQKARSSLGDTVKYLKEG